MKTVQMKTTRRWIPWMSVVALAGSLWAAGPAMAIITPADDTGPVQSGGFGGGSGGGFSGGSADGSVGGFGGGGSVGGFGDGAIGGIGGGFMDPSDLEAIMAASMAMAEPRNQAARAALDAAQARANAAAERLKTVRERVNAGMQPTVDLTEADAAYKVALADVAQKEALLSSARSIFGAGPGLNSNLAKPVDVQLQKATVRQAAEALSRASGVPIAVGEGVAKDLRITIDARRMPLSTVLDAIGKQTGLMISPEGEGVRLDVWPSLTVDGVKTQKSGRMAPWSDEWGIPPTAFSRLPGFVAGLPTILGTGGGTVGRRLLGGNARPADVEVSTANDMIIVSESGMNAAGAAGLWLTAYRVVGNRIEPAGSTFYPFRNESPGMATGLTPGVMSGAAPAMRNQYKLDVMPEMARLRTRIEVGQPNGTAKPVMPPAPSKAPKPPASR